MIDPANLPPVAADELLARYILFRDHIRTSDQTVKANAFIPHPHSELSVNRHHSCTSGEIWAFGHAVAEKRDKTLHGRADVRANDFAYHELSVDPDPIEGNPNHSIVTGWPQAKHDQKIIALEIAAVAAFVPAPESV